MSEDPLTESRPYYEADGIQIWHGDCRHIDAWDITGGVMVTDPPYGMAFESNMHGPALETRQTEHRPVSIVGDSTTDVRDTILDRWAPRPALVFGTWKCERPTGVRHVMTWVKGDHLGMGDLTIPWKPNTEEVYVIGSGFVGRRDTSALNYPGPVTWATKGRTHPHEKPVALMSALIAKCPPLATVVDPFMGSGSTLVAAQRAGRSAIGVELDERYCEIAVRRLAQRSLFAESL
jgi:hypothetical protein